jgi:hypothetical protein
MDCELARNRIVEDPAHVDPTIELHVAGCPACTAFFARVAEAERRIQKALRFDIAALRTVHAANKARPVKMGRTDKRNGLAALAAACVAGLALWVGVWIGSSRSPAVFDAADFAAVIEAHWYDEPDSWVRSDVQVSNAALDAALDGQARVDLAALGTITYARSCLVDGQWVPHLVLQGSAGPVMLLLIPHRHVPDSLPLQLPREGIDGRLLPYAGGSIAVMGEDGEAFDEIERRVAAAVQWTI